MIDGRVRHVAVALAFLAGCGGMQDWDQAAKGPMTYEEFKGQAYQEPDTGVWIHNGDELAETEEQLAASYERYVEQWAQGGNATASEPLIVNRVGGADDKWSSATALNLTYCIQRSSFTTTQYNAVVSAMNSAAGAWEATARVNFIHSSSLDGNCTSRTSGVVFNVRRVTTSQYLARAFFPSTSRRSRELLIASSSFGNISPWSLTGVLRHELGHTIGFRHEHTRPESGTCFEDNSWRALTAYDSSSVMHYPQCNGTQNGDLVLTNSDKSGAASLYP
jgi:serralysin